MDYYHNSQLYPNGCGGAILKTIFQSYKVNVEVDEVNQLSISKMISLLESAQIKCSGRKYKQLKDVPSFSILVLAKQGVYHYVLLYRKGDYYLISDQQRKGYQ